MGYKKYIGIIGGNSIPQIVSYSDDSTNLSPTNVGEEVVFNATWVDTDPNEQGKLIVCPLEGGMEDYSCDAGTCPGNITFGGQREGVKNYLSEENQKKSLKQVRDTWFIRDQFSESIGVGKYAMVEYDKVKRFSSHKC